LKNIKLLTHFKQISLKIKVVTATIIMIIALVSVGGIYNANYNSSKSSLDQYIQVFGSVYTTQYGVTTASSSSIQIIDATKYNLDTTGATDTTLAFQKMTDSFPTGSDLRIPAGTYKFEGTVNLKSGIKIEAQSDVIIIGISSNTLFNASSNTTFSGIGFQNCNIAINIFQQTGVTVYWCNFKNSIVYSAIEIYNGSNISISSCFLYEIKKYGVFINGDNSDISITWNNFSNPSVFGGYTTEQISAHVYCLSGTKITVANNILNNNGGQGVIFCYNSITGKGVTNSSITSNHCEGNGQEGTTVYGGSAKVTSGNSVIGNTCINNRLNQIEIWQSDNNIVQNNTAQESIAGIGNLAAICLFATNGTTCTGNKVLSSESNGISIIAGTSNSVVSNNTITDTNKAKDTTKPEKGNGILLDWNGVADPEYITIENNTMSSSNGIIAKSGVYSTSNTNHHNKIDGNVITGYQYGVHPYALATCEPS